MIATCPACGKRYRLADDAVPPGGRSVRCAACGNGWTVQPAAPPAAPLLPFDLPDAAVSPRAFAGNASAYAAPADASPVVAVSAVPAPAATADAVADVPPRRRGWLIATLLVAVTLAALAVVEFAPANTFDPPRLGLPPARLPLADLGSLAVPSLPPLDLARVPVIGATLDGWLNPPPAPPSPLRITASGERRHLPGGRWFLTVTGTVANPTAAPVALAGIDAVLVDPSGHLSFRWRVAAPASIVDAHASVAFETTAANFPPAATRLRLTPR